MRSQVTGSWRPDEVWAMEIEELCRRVGCSATVSAYYASQWIGYAVCHGRYRLDLACLDAPGRARLLAWIDGLHADLLAPERSRMGPTDRYPDASLT